VDDLLTHTRAELEAAIRAAHEAGARHARRELMAALGERLLAGGVPFTKALPADDDDAGDTHPHHAVGLAMLDHAAECAEAGIDAGPGLRALAELADSPEGLAGALGGQGVSEKAFAPLVCRAVILKAWRSEQHPRDDHGRFVSVEAIHAAKSDPKKAEELRKRVTDPEQRKKLDAALEGKTDLGRTKHGEARDAARGRREAKQASAAAARDILTRLHGGGPEVTADDLYELADHLPALTVEHLRRARLLLGAKWGVKGNVRKEHMVSAMVAHARKAGFEARLGEHGDDGTMRAAAGIDATPGEVPERPTREHLPANWRDADKPVPPEVLADYPDLKPAADSQPPAPPPAAPPAERSDAKAAEKVASDGPGKPGEGMGHAERSKVVRQRRGELNAKRTEARKNAGEEAGAGKPAEKPAGAPTHSVYHDRGDGQPPVELATFPSAAAAAAEHAWHADHALRGHRTVTTGTETRGERGQRVYVGPSGQGRPRPTAEVEAEQLKVAAGKLGFVRNTLPATMPDGSVAAPGTVWTRFADGRSEKMTDEQVRGLVGGR